MEERNKTSKKKKWFDVEFRLGQKAELVLKTHREHGLVAKTLHCSQSTQRYILGWGLLAPDPGYDILSAPNKNSLSAVRGYIRSLTTSLPPCWVPLSLFHDANKADSLEHPPLKFKKDIADLQDVPSWAFQVWRNNILGGSQK